MGGQVEIVVVQDLSCPWCRIGKAFLKQALDQWHGEPWDVRWMPFQLNPAMPVNGRDFRRYMATLKGGEAVDGLLESVTQAGAHAGLTFRFDLVQRAPNTLMAHRLIALTPEDRKDGLVDLLHTAYFELGEDIGNLDVLTDIAVAVGHDRLAISAGLAGDEGLAEVEYDLSKVRESQITGVPLFVINSAAALSGAVPPQTLLDTFQRVSQIVMMGNPAGQG